MALDADNEILQDFLVEAGELLEGLNEQLVELEQSPDDSDLLNAVFRSFHTIKGGAGFLELDPLVEVCHRAEDVFNLLRSGEKSVDADLMDVILRALDVLNDMFASLQEGEEPATPDPELLAALDRLKVADADAGQESAEQEAAAAEPQQQAVGSDTQPDDLMGSIEAARERDREAEGAAGEAESDEITDDEFESLLDELHGEGKHHGVPDKTEPETPAAGDSGKSGDDEITEEEFEKLLDDLHGEGKGPVAGEAKSKDEPAEPPSEPKKPAPKPAPAKADKPKKSAAPAPKVELIRVDTRRLDAIMNLVGELVLVRNQLNTLQQTHEHDQIGKAIANLDMVTSDLQAAVMKTRMQPIKKVFGRFPRVVRDLSRQLDKEIDLVMEGEDTDLDKNLVEALADPLVHLIRNAVDHGIEMPDDREANGKPRTGQVKLAASQEGDHILLTIADDGRGMNAEALRRKAVEKGLMDEESAARMNEQECYEVILMPGFSTKDQISDISGRGVGMDVVKTAINKLSGSVEIDSDEGEGTTLKIKVPLTLAILPTLMVVVNGRKFAMPLSNISEIIDFADRKTNYVDGQLSINIRDRAVPVFHLRDWLAHDAMPAQETDQSEHQSVLVQVGNQTVGLVVDQVLGQEEVVIKPLGEMLHGVPGIAGATITGEGQIALILDIGGLLRFYGKHRRRVA